MDGVFGQIGAHVQFHVMVENREELEHVQTQHRLVGEPPVREKMYSSSHVTNNHVKVCKSREYICYLKNWLMSIGY